ncbi:MAG: hypothetical protein WBC62_01410 [Candidatus Macondimonas sp.]
MGSFTIKGDILPSEEIEYLFLKLPGFKMKWHGHGRFCRIQSTLPNYQDGENVMVKSNPNVMIFEPDDKKYLAWINEHPEGFVLTSNKSLTPRHTVIHSASCHKIKMLTGNAEPGGFTERKYIKIYAGSVGELERWVREKRADASSRECSLCI